MCSDIGFLHFSALACPWFNMLYYGALLEALGGEFAKSLTEKTRATELSVQQKNQNQCMLSHTHTHTLHTRGHAGGCARACRIDPLDIRSRLASVKRETYIWYQYQCRESRHSFQRISISECRNASRCTIPTTRIYRQHRQRRRQVWQGSVQDLLRKRALGE